MNFNRADALLKKAFKSVILSNFSRQTATISNYDFFSCEANAKESKLLALGFKKIKRRLRDSQKKEVFAKECGGGVKLMFWTVGRRRRRICGAIMVYVKLLLFADFLLCAKFIVAALNKDFFLPFEKISHPRRKNILRGNFFAHFLNAISSLTAAHGNEKTLAREQLEAIEIFSSSLHICSFCYCPHGMISL